MLGIYDGRARIFWLDVTRGGIHVQPHEHQPTVKITPRKPSGPSLPAALSGPDLARARGYWERKITLSPLQRVPPFGGAWRREYRIPRRAYGATFDTGIFSSYIRFPVL